MLHDLTTNGIDAATRRHFKKNAINSAQQTHFINRLEGYINFIGQVRGRDDVIYWKLKQLFDSYDFPIVI